MTNISQIMVGVLIFCMAIGPQTLWASFGPCTVDSNEQFANNIQCSNGACTGLVQIIPVQTTCKNTGEDPCSQNNNAASYITYGPATTTNGTAYVLTQLGLGATCAACVIGVCAVTGWSGPGAVTAVSVACGAGCAVAFSQINLCSFTTCTQDLATKVTVYGGHSC